MLDALTHDQIRTFVAVADAGSFRAAAARLNRVQSAISHAIGNLEAELGVVLFDRSGHRPVLTPEGQALLADARAVLLKLDLMRARARGLRENVELSLSIAVDTLYPLPVIGAALHALRSAYPTTAVRLRVVPMAAPVADLREGRCTIGITVGQDFRDPRIELEALSTLAFVAVCSAGHPLAVLARKGQPVGNLELADHLQIVLEDPSAESEGRDFGVLSPQTWRVSGQDVKHALILAGLGWGRLPLWQIERDLAEERLLRLNAAALGPAGETREPAYLAWRTDAPFGAASRAFCDAVRKHCADQASGLPRRP